MKKFFRRREFLSRHARIAVEGFVTAWVVQSWLGDWGEPGTRLWWLNLVLQSIVALVMFVLLATKPKHEPTFAEQLKAYLKRENRVLVTQEVAARIVPAPLGVPVVESPYAPEGKFFMVNPKTLADVIAKSDPTQFRFTEKSPSMPASVDRSTLERIRSLSERTEEERRLLFGDDPSKRAEQERFDLLTPPHERPIRDTTEYGS